MPLNKETKDKINVDVHREKDRGKKKTDKKDWWF